jgi:putative transposase
VTSPPGEEAVSIYRSLVASAAPSSVKGVAPAFDAVLADVGIEVAKITPRSPRANAYAERFVLTARTEITARMLIFGERYLRTILTEYQGRYNGRRPPSRSPDDTAPPQPDNPATDLSCERIRRRPVLGGLINEYE